MRGIFTLEILQRVETLLRDRYQNPNLVLADYLNFIAKQRNGPVGEIPLTFLKEFTRFETRARNASEAEEAF